ncbi:hypothetical protein EDC04DRAFT_2575425 [Pisolithus marmoratus]|nr:hypothetical protein EDC04DRAFT_2575425 [Pisolithus marmoratus]
MGISGSGKSSFIANVTSTDEGVGHSLVSCTTEIKATRAVVEGSSVVLVDTPGFHNTDRSDLEVSQMISDWLYTVYPATPMPSAILYFHRISDNRIVETSLKDIRVIQELCRRNKVARVVLVTTMWDEVACEFGEERLRELKGDYWKAMRLQGATTFKHLNTRESAMQLLRFVLSWRNEEVEVRLQREISDMQLELQQTAARRMSYSSLEDRMQRWTEMLRRIRAEIDRKQQKTSRENVEVEA